MVNISKDRTQILEMKRRNPALEGSETWTSIQKNDVFLMDVGGLELLFRVCLRKHGTKLKIEYSNSEQVTNDVSKELMKISAGKVFIASFVLLHIPKGIKYP